MTTRDPRGWVSVCVTVSVTIYDPTVTVLGLVGARGRTIILRLQDFKLRLVTSRVPRTDYIVTVLELFPVPLDLG